MRLETRPQEQGALENRFARFLDLEHDQNWDETVREGAQLYTLLKSKDPKSALEVKEILKRTRLVIHNSGAGDSDLKLKLIAQIDSILNT